MSIRLLAAAALVAGCLSPVSAAAQSPSASPMTSEAGAPAKKMSDADKAAWTQCKAMTKEAMKKDATCNRLIKAYPHSEKWTKPDGAKTTPPTK